MSHRARTSFRLFLAGAVLATSSAGLAQTAGTLVSADPVVDTPGGLQAWRVTYVTADAANRPRTVTGMVVAPREAQPAAPRNVVAWTHGTSGVVERCGLSARSDFFTFTPGLTDMVRRGFVVVAPDYPGLGSSGAHPYLVGVDTGNSVLDAVRAARSISGAYAGSRFAVWGESQGGHAALWTGIRARRYAPDLSLVGIAAAAPPTDLASNLKLGSDANVRTMLTAYASYSWSKHYGAPLSSLGNKSTQGVITRLAQNNCVELNKSPKLGTILGIVTLRNALKKVDFGSRAPWSGFAASNSISAAQVPGPVFIAQSVSDPVVAPSVTRAFARKLCQRGTRVQWLSLPGGDHAHSARDSAGPTLDWIAARFAGQAAMSSCRSI
ncbi:alpha/beta fold hydrolase [Novosphingobium aquiterrae]|uniref:Alpha/beta fold hydrolase n=1 Tax=Novosphingobium aquiterrae TaxID=624388 RepID=A0ABV6PGU2_9SPHN